jgi:isoquinoline 1-oxidoreductase beta subunit
MAGLINGELHERHYDSTAPSQHRSTDRYGGGAWQCGGVPHDKEPLQFLLSMLASSRDLDAQLWRGRGGGSSFGHPIDAGRMRNVLLLAAARAGWRSPLPARQGRGIAAHHGRLTYIGTIAHVAVAEDGRVSVPRIDLAVDCGMVVNAGRAAEAFRGAAIIALGDTLSSLASLHAKDQVSRADHAPDIRIHIVRSDARSGDVGEDAGVPPVVAAILNALFAATGQRPVDPALLKFH